MAASAALSRRPTTGSYASDGTDSLSKRPSRVIAVDRKTTLTCEHIEVASILLPPTQPTASKRANKAAPTAAGAWKSIANSFKVKPMPEVDRGRSHSVSIPGAKAKTDSLSASAPAGTCPALSDALTHRCSKVNFAPLPPAPERGRSPANPSYGVSARGNMIRGQSAPAGGSSNLPGYNAQVARGGFSQLGGLSEADMISWRDLVRGTKKMCTKLAKGEVATGRAAGKGSDSDSEPEVDEDSDDSDSEVAPKTPPQLPTQPTVAPKSIIRPAQPVSAPAPPSTRVAPPSVPVEERQPDLEKAASSSSQANTVAPVQPIALPVATASLVEVQPQPQPAATTATTTTRRRRASKDISDDIAPPPVPIVQPRRGSLTTKMLTEIEGAA